MTYLLGEKYIPFPFHNSWSRFKRLSKRSQSDSLKGTKKKEKAEVDKIGKDATGLEAKSLFGLAMIQKEFSSSRESRDRFIIHLGLHFQC